MMSVHCFITNQSKYQEVIILEMKQNKTNKKQQQKKLCINLMKDTLTEKLKKKVQFPHLDVNYVIRKCLLTSIKDIILVIGAHVCECGELEIRRV